MTSMLMAITGTPVENQFGMRSGKILSESRIQHPGHELGSGTRVRIGIRLRLHEYRAL